VDLTTACRSSCMPLLKAAGDLEYARRHNIPLSAFRGQIEHNVGSPRPRGRDASTNTSWVTTRMVNQACMCNTPWVRLARPTPLEGQVLGLSCTPDTRTAKPAATTNERQTSTNGAHDQWQQTPTRDNRGESNPSSGSRFPCTSQGTAANAGGTRKPEPRDVSGIRLWPHETRRDRHEATRRQDSPQQGRQVKPSGQPPTRHGAPLSPWHGTGGATGGGLSVRQEEAKYPVPSFEVAVKLLPDVQSMSITR
jgi:hypothetical protein